MVYSQVPDTLRAKLEREAAVFDQRFGSARDHGLEEGESAPDYCGPYDADSSTITYAPPETTDVELALMLAEVAVTATTSEVIPGFDAEGNPYVLLALSEIDPLFSDSQLPAYALVAVESLVIGDRVYCGTMPFANTTPYQPRAGGRVALGGFLASSSTTIVVDPVHDGFLAASEVANSQFRLNWKSHARKQGPTRMAGLRVLADGLVSRGLRDLTRDLRSLDVSEEEYDERIGFADFWNETTEKGCGVLGAERLSDSRIELRLQPCPE